MKRLAQLLMVTWLLGASSSPAAADNREAATIFRAGQSAFARGDYRAAAAAFEQAATIAPNADAWFFAGEAWERGGDEARAVFALERAVALGLEEKRAVIARSRLEALRPRLAKVRIEGPEGGRIAVANVRDAELPIEVYLPPGDHTVRLIAGPGAGVSKSVVARIGEPISVVFEAPVEPPKPVLSPPAIPGAPQRRAPMERPQPESVSPLVVVGWSAIGVGAAAGVAAIVLGTRGLSARDDWEANRKDLDLRERAENLRLAANIAWAGAGVLTASGVAIVVASAVVSSRPAAAPATSLVLSPRAAHAVVRW